MKYFKIEVERTYTTEVYVKCKDEKTVQDVLDATFSDRMLFDAQIKLWDYIVEEEMEQCVVLDSITHVEECHKKPRSGWSFDLDAEIIEDDA